MRSSPRYEKLNTAATSVMTSFADGGTTKNKNRNRPRVLLVDDDKFVLASLARLLRHEPFSILEASSGAEAIALLEKDPVTLVISDQVMPKMTGLQLLDKVEKRWPETIRVILSGYTKVDVIIEAINSGTVYKYLTKPWNDEELKLNIRRAIEQYDLKVENDRMADQIFAQNRQLYVLNERLKQRARDADTVLTLAHEIIDAVEIGILGIDDAKMLVWQNAWARSVFPPVPGASIGAPLSDVLPRPFFEAISGALKDVRHTRGRWGEQGGRSFEYRTSDLAGKSAASGKVIVFWEVAP